MNIKRTILLFFLSCSLLQLLAQEEGAIKSRVIFIGNAGEQQADQQRLMNEASELVIPGKTQVFFLGDNIYPKGMDLESPQRERAQEILRAQFSPFRQATAPVYFIPGNRDWGRSGKAGLKKIQAQARFLNTIQDSLLKMIPDQGCPDPVEVPISEDLTVIAYDSEWWLFPYDKSRNDTTCNCNTPSEVQEALDELLYKNRNKTVLLASHHPFATNGVHGGRFSWKDHLFPLTNINSGLFLPLPLVGSLYPILRSTVFLHPEDLYHPIYQHMIGQIKESVEDFPNLVYVAGHEHGLQLIQTGEQLQIVSGGGSRGAYVKQAKNSLFAKDGVGLVVVDEQPDRDLSIRYFELDGQQLKETFQHQREFAKAIPLQDSLFLRRSDEDSAIVQANPLYDQVGKFHRTLFGENYRKEWAAKTKLPIIRVSSFQGGLSPLQRGGGMQSVSLRLEDKSGKQWVMRSVNKNTDALLPPELRHTFARDFLDDANSAQHPYGALMIPPLADAVGVYHANPIIGVIAPDTALGAYNRLFANTLALVEEREPVGKSDNTPKMIKKINNDNDDIYQAKTFLRARMLDLLVSDWDRHEDQWRWYDENKKSDKDYAPVPRDRDQAFRIVEGWFPYLASRKWVLPTLQGFRSNVPSPPYSLFKSRFLNAHPKNQFSHEEWTEVTEDFVKKMTDQILEESVKRLPPEIYALRADSLLATLKKRRDAIPQAMEDYYRFINEIVDIKLSDKHEWVSVEDAPNKGLRVTVRKINKEGERKGVLMKKDYDPNITKEIRIYLGEGNDTLQLANTESDIRLRIIGGKGEKTYEVQETKHAVRLYDLKHPATFSGESANRLKKHLSNDSAQTDFVPVNLYNIWMPLVTAGYNADDGFMFGGGFLYTHQKGFRKSPFASQHQLLVSGAFATGAMKVRYKGIWTHVLGKADFLLNLNVNAPNNTQNFFGLGNNSVYNKADHNIRYYRTRFNLYDLQSALQWRPSSTLSFHVGPTFQLYYYDSDDNVGRFINNTNQLHTYDSLTIAKDKIFAGLNASLLKDNRDNKLLPTHGGYLQVNVKGLTGLNDYSKSYAQATGELALYASIWQNSVTFADRVGGGITLGKTTFYQALFLGGQHNLWGYRQYRYAGEQVFFNNFETRVKIAQIGSYIAPGQLGLLGFYDVGKVWAEGLDQGDLHQGTGAGVFYAPAGIAVLQLVAGHSKEGWYPYFTMGFRF